MTRKSFVHFVISLPRDLNAYQNFRKYINQLPHLTENDVLLIDNCWWQNWNREIKIENFILFVLFFFFCFLFYLSFNDKVFLSFRCDTMCFFCQIWNLVLPIQDPYLHSAVCHSINWSAFSPRLLFLSCYRSLFTRTQAKICVAATWISRLLESGIFLSLNFVFIMNILCFYLTFFTLSPYIYILSITLVHERKIVSLQVQYPDLKCWDNFSSHWIANYFFREDS